MGDVSIFTDYLIEFSSFTIAIMDNYYVDKPLWRVDLGTKNTINGAVILTWQGAGQGMFNFTIRGRQYFLLKNGLLVSAP